MTGMLKRAAAAVLILTAAGCSLIDLEESVLFTSVPSRDYEILAGDTLPSLTFCEPVDPYTVEQIVSVRDEEGRLDASFAWEGPDSLRLDLTDPLIPGRRYRLEVEGIYAAASGRERRVGVSIPFYSVTDTYAPLKVLSVTPAGGSVAAGDVPVVITFNREPDEASVRKGLTLSPDTDHTFSRDGAVVTLTPVEGWDNLTDYRVALNTGVTDPEGMPLDPEFEQTFHVLDGTSLPAVETSGTCLKDRSASFPRLTGDLNLLEYDQALRITFSEEMDKSSVEGAFSLTPVMTGDIYWVPHPGADCPDREDLVFVPRTGPVMGETYSLVITEAALSRKGIAMEKDYIKEFTPAIPVLELEQLECLTGAGFTLTSYSTVTPADLPSRPVSPYDISFRLSFSRPFAADEEKQAVQNSLSVFEVFSSGGSPRAGSFSWSNDLTLTVLFSGFNAAADEEHYYVMELKGGESGIRNREGSFLKETVKQLFRVAKL